MAKKTGGAKKAANARGVAKTPRATGGAKSALGRVARVAKELGQQATAAVTEGVETLREMGETLVERVTTSTEPS